MADPILVVDFGTTSSSASLVTDGGPQPVKEPGSGSYSWPSSVCLDGERLLVGTAAERRKRSDPSLYRAEFKRDLGQDAPILLGERSFTAGELVAAAIRALAVQARTLIPEPVERLLLTVPASYRPGDPRWEAMIAAGEAAGFAEVELLTEPVAAALAPTGSGAFAPGDLVLVHDFGGGTFDAALVRFTRDSPGFDVLGHAALDDCGGRDIDALLTGRVRTTADAELTDLLATGGLPGMRMNLALGDLVRGLKHQLTDTDWTEDFLTPLAPPYALDRAALEELVRPVLDRTLACCRDLLQRCEVTADQVTAVLLSGGASRMPVVAATVEKSLGLPIRAALDPDLAVVQGAAAHAAHRPTRVLPPDAPPSGEVPLRWKIPGGTAKLLRWLIRPGENYAADAPLAVVRAADSALWHLHAPAKAGMLGHVHAAPGDRVTEHDWLATSCPPRSTRTSAFPSAPAASNRPTRRVLSGHTDWVNAVAFSHDGALLASAGRDASARLWDLDGIMASGTGEIPFARFGLGSASHSGEVCAVAFSHDSGYIVSGGAHGAVRRWDVHARRPTGGAWTGPEVWASSASFGDGGPLADRSWRPLTDWVRSVAFSPDGTLLAGGGDDRTIRLWNTATGRPVSGPPTVHTGEVRSVAFGPGGALLASGSTDRTVQLWNISAGRPSDYALPPVLLCSLIGHTDWVRSVAFSPDGTLLASGSDDRTIRLWSPATGEPVGGLLTGHAAKVFTLAFSPDGSLLASGSTDRTVRLWEARTGNPIGSPLQGHTAEVRSVAFSPDGSLLASAGKDKTIRLWDVASLL